MEGSRGGKISRQWGLSSARADGGGVANRGPGGGDTQDCEEGV